MDDHRAQAYRIRLTDRLVYFLLVGRVGLEPTYPRINLRINLFLKLERNCFRNHRKREHPTRLKPQQYFS